MTGECLRPPDVLFGDPEALAQGAAVSWLAMEALASVCGPSNKNLNPLKTIGAAEYYVAARVSKDLVLTVDKETVTSAKASAGGSAVESVSESAVGIAGEITGGSVTGDSSAQRIEVQKPRSMVRTWNAPCF